GGAGFSLGGIVCGISQLIGIDNKQGRAAQWLSFGLVFLGFAVDRGKHLAKIIKNNKSRPEITKVARQWEVDLTKIFDVKNNNEKNLLNKTLNAIKKEKELPNSNYKKIDEFFNTLSGKKYITETTEVKEKLDKTLTKNIASNVNVLKRDGKNVEITNPAEIKNILSDIETQTKAIFGEKPIKAEV
ncbi:MAG TPA: hypothetical protein DDW90_03260, partial [Cyanobacteria bacterium UBA9971]|nr:hypothetical protein [Cyanobacteria bacterium UBA9971]